MLAILALLVAALCPVTCAQSATIFPVALGPEANLRGEVIGSGGEVGTTYVLSGETLGTPFTMTLAQDASFIVQRVSIPTLSVDHNAGCIVSAGSAVCVNIVASAGVTSTLPITTLPYSPFAVPVSTSGVVASSSSGALESTTTGIVTSSSSVTASASISSAPVATLASPNASQSSTSDALTSCPNMLMVLMFAVSTGVLWITA
ncbi:hypothetical protein ACEPAF_8607 [Sanghuangporus sanghuang]